MTPGAKAGIHDAQRKNARSSATGPGIHQPLADRLFCFPWRRRSASQFYYSLCDYPLARPPMYIGTQNYRWLLHDPLFWRSTRNTIYYAAMALPAGMLVSLGLAQAPLLNAKVWRAGSLSRTIIFLPSLDSRRCIGDVVALGSSISKLGLFNHLLGNDRHCRPAVAGREKLGACRGVGADESVGCRAIPS